MARDAIGIDLKKVVIPQSLKIYIGRKGSSLPTASQMSTPGWYPSWSPGIIGAITEDGGPQWSPAATDEVVKKVGNTEVKSTYEVVTLTFTAAELNSVVRELQSGRPSGATGAGTGGMFTGREFNVFVEEAHAWGLMERKAARGTAVVVPRKSVRGEVKGYDVTFTFRRLSTSSSSSIIETVVDNPNPNKDYPDPDNGGWEWPGTSTNPDTNPEWPEWPQGPDGPENPYQPPNVSGQKETYDEQVITESGSVISGMNLLYASPSVGTPTVISQGTSALFMPIYLPKGQSFSKVRLINGARPLGELDTGFSIYIYSINEYGEPHGDGYKLFEGVKPSGQVNSPTFEIGEWVSPKGGAYFIGVKSWHDTTPSRANMASLNSYLSTPLNPMQAPIIKLNGLLSSDKSIPPIEAENLYKEHILRGIGVEVIV